MKKFLAALMIFCGINLYAQDQVEAMKKWTEYMTPGPMHQLIAKMEGNWKTVMTFTDPESGNEMKSEGKASFQLILGGRYMKSSYTGEMMGMPFEGFGLDAYDNGNKQFVSIWADNMGTGIMVMKGKLDEKSGTVVFSGEGYDPSIGKNMKYRSVSKWINDDKTTFEMYGEVNGKEELMFTMEYTREK
jgi:hypothetical protein